LDSDGRSCKQNEKKTVDEFFKDSSAKMATFQFTVLCESARNNTRQQLYLGRRPLEAYSDDIATTFEELVLDGRNSPYASLCNLAMIMQGKSNKLPIVWVYSGCRSWKEYFEKHPDVISILPNDASAHSGVIQRRMRDPLKRFETPFCLGDPDLRKEEGYVRLKIEKFACSTRDQLGDGLDGQLLSALDARWKAEFPDDIAARRNSIVQDVQLSIPNLPQDSCRCSRQRCFGGERSQC
jgi:hypothetical protein